eukprot:3220307-Prorocentrum_lima.AAC.1
MWRPFCSPRWAGRATPASAGLGGLPVNNLHVRQVVEAVRGAGLRMDVGYHAVRVRVAVHVPGYVHS